MNLRLASLFALWLVFQEDFCMSQEGVNKPAPLVVQKILKEGNQKKAGHTTFYTPAQIKVFMTWFEARVTKGKTTTKEVKALLGPKGIINLDRPKRDQVEVWEYHLSGDYTNGSYLVMTFAPKGAPKKANLDNWKLKSWSLSYSICGFCPHVYSLDQQNRWRLEGKLLANCVGQENIGKDIIVLPRAKLRDEKVVVKLDNSASEIEYIKELVLLSVEVDDDEQLDITPDGNLVAWSPQLELPVDWNDNEANQEQITLPVDRCDYLVLEVRNTAPLEEALRKQYLGGVPLTEAPSLSIEMGDQVCQINPVGSKFTRRIVLPLAPHSEKAIISGIARFWDIPRAWTGKGRTVRQPKMTLPQEEPVFELRPGQHKVLTFPVPQPNNRKLAFALQVRGYYEFETTH